MRNLNAQELLVINNVSRQLNPGIRLGDKIDEIISALASEDTPVNAVKAVGTLTLLGVVKHGEHVAIGGDVYEFLADAAQSKSYYGNIAVNIAASAVKAAGVLSMATQPTAGDTLTIGSKTYIFVPVGTNDHDGDVSIGNNAAAAQANLVAAINGMDGVNTAHPQVTAGDFAANDCAITALVGGSDGNNIATTETFTAAGNVFGAAKLATGADCSAANAITALVAAVAASDTQGVGAADGAGDTVVFTADVAGETGNLITTVADMANGSFGAGVLMGGQDGTLAEPMAIRVDASYLYVCFAGNAASGQNWRRVSLGAAY
jgi:hypothetical protein